MVVSELALVKLALSTGHITKLCADHSGNIVYVLAGTLQSELTKDPEIILGG